MALNIKNPEVEALASEIAKMTGESKTEAIRKALLERKQHLASHVIYEDRRGRLRGGRGGVEGHDGHAGADADGRVFRFRRRPRGDPPDGLDRDPGRTRLKRILAA